MQVQYSLLINLQLTIPAWLGGVESSESLKFSNVGKYYKLYFECLLLVLTSFCLSKIKKVIKITLNTRNDSPTIYFIGNGVGNMLKQAKLRFARCGINRMKLRKWF